MLCTTAGIFYKSRGRQSDNLRTDYPHQSQGDTLGGINLTLIITAPMEEVIRVQTYHHLGAVNAYPAFEINAGAKPLKTDENDERIIIYSGSLALEIGKKHWRMRYTPEMGSWSRNPRQKTLPLMKTDWKGLAYDRGDYRDTYMRQQLGISVDEKLYGLGERFTPFVRNGQSIKIWNATEGQAPNSAIKIFLLYLHKGYGVFVNHPENVEFEIGTEMVTKAEFSVEGTYLDYFLINGPEMKDVLRRYTDLTGKPGLPAPCTFRIVAVHLLYDKLR